MKYISSLGVVIGAVMQGLAMSLFLFPHDIPSGGAAGLTILVHYFFEIPRGTALWLVNFVFFSVALKYFGYTWTVKSMISVTTTSITVSLVEAFAIVPHLNLLFDFALGSLLFGVGVGILIRSGSSSGGMVIPALMIAKSKGLPPGKVMFWMNISIFLITALVIDYKIVIYSIACQWFSTKCIDYIYHFQLPKINTPSYAFRKKP